MVWWWRRRAPMSCRGLWWWCVPSREGAEGFLRREVGFRELEGAHFICFLVCCCPS
ncbi:hypothetical protein OIU77_001380, partial [Salix suchowensis]